MRWALFPSLAAIAATVGGALAWTGRPDFIFRVAVLAAGFGTAAAFAAVCSRRTWLALLAAPPFAVLAAATALALDEAYRMGSIKAMSSPWFEAANILKDSRMAALTLCVSFPQTLAHRLSFTRPWPAAVGIWLGAALLTTALGVLLSDPYDRSPVGLYLVACTLSQIAAPLGARAVARRLRPPEAA